MNYLALTSDVMSSRAVFRSSLEKENVTARLMV